MSAAPGRRFDRRRRIEPFAAGRAARSRKFKGGLIALMLGATFVLALSSVLFKYFAIRDDFWTTTFWTFVGEGLFGALLLLVPAYRRQFAALFRQNPGAVIGVNAANELINLGGGLSVRLCLPAGAGGGGIGDFLHHHALRLLLRHPAHPVLSQASGARIFRRAILSERRGCAADHGRRDPDRAALTPVLQGGKLSPDSEAV